MFEERRRKPGPPGNHLSENFFPPVARVGRVKPACTKRALFLGLVLLIICLILLMTRSRTFASWIVDEARFHMAAHGQIACSDCHESVDRGGMHPDPRHVNKTRADFFKIEMCISCHEEIMENLAQGLHRGKDIQEGITYVKCLGCHEPHYGPRRSDEETGRFDPRKPPFKQCDACHEDRIALPFPPEEDKSCLACHGLVDRGDPRGKEKIEKFCFHCHGDTGTWAQQVTGRFTPLMDSHEYSSYAHAQTACSTCHPGSTGFRHADQAPAVQCRRCHLPHDAKVARDAHVGIACEACHLKGVRVARDRESGQVLWKAVRQPGRPHNVHQMMPDVETCKRCHFKGNRVGAAAMVLPAKGILCMPCHASTFSAGDATTFVALIIFLTGIACFFSYAITGSVPGIPDGRWFGRLYRLTWIVVRSVFSSRCLWLLKAVVLDVLLQRRLYRRSRSRWIIHGLIFFPFLFRFSWGMAALLGSLWRPGWAAVWFMLDGNHPVTAFLFDLTGLMLFLGVIVALWRGAISDSKRFPGLPAQDRLALCLIGAVVLIGFTLEGARIAMTGWPRDANYAIAGYGISMLFRESGALSEVYVYLWYCHAVLTGAFVAYLPFSRLFHVIMAPVALAMDAVSEKDHDGKRN